MQITCGGELVTLERPTIPEPTTCPVCGAPTTRTLRGKEGVVTYCSNKACSGQAIGKIKGFISKTEIMGVGDSVLEALVDAGLVKTPADLYRLTVDKLVDLQIGANKSGAPIRLGSSRTNSLLREIEKAKQLPLIKFLGGLGVELLGRRRVEIIAKEQGLTTLEDWLDKEKLKLIPGDATRKAITEGLQKAWPTINDLLSVGVMVLPHKVIQRAVFLVGSEPEDETVVTEPKKNTIANCSFCFTGTRELLAETAAIGGEIKSGVSKDLNYLVQKNATSQSSKSRKADEYGVKIISIDTLRAVLAGERELP